MDAPHGSIGRWSATSRSPRTRPDLPGLPGNKYPHLFAFYAFPIPGHKPQEMAAAIHAEIERLKKEDISDEELKMIKTRAKANLIRSLGSNEGLAFALGLNQARYDDWRELFRSVDRIEKVTKADIRRVANQTFVPDNRTVGIIEFAGASAGRAPQGGGHDAHPNAERGMHRSRYPVNRRATLLSIVLCSRPVYSDSCSGNRRRLQASAADLAADTDSEVARVSSAAAEAHRVAEWHGGFSSGRPRVADH